MICIQSLLKNSLFTFLFVFLISNISHADQSLALNESLDCELSDTGEHKLFETKKGKTSEVDFAKAAKSAKGKLQKASDALSSAKKSGAAKAKITKLTEKKNEAKKLSGNINKCKKGTLTEEDVSVPVESPAGTLLSSAVMTRFTTVNPGGVTCELSTGKTAQLSAAFGSEQFVSDRVVGLFGCRTNDGKTFDAKNSVGSFSQITITGFFFSLATGTPSGIAGFSKKDIPESATFFVQKLCEVETECKDIEKVHADHKSGSSSDITVNLEFGPGTGHSDIQGEFGGKGK